MTTFVDLHRSDFNFSNLFDPSSFSDSFGDILWRDAAGDDVLWTMIENTPSTITALPRVTPDWHVKATANFDITITAHDPLIDADILWQNDNGALVLWQMSGGTILNTSALPNPGPSWHVVGDNDFNGDGADDILWQNDNGALAIWTITSASSATISSMLAGVQNPGPSWHVVATGDAAGTGFAGILLQHTSGALVLWEGQGFSASLIRFNTIAELFTVDPSWHVKGMADLNGDRTADILFQNDNGAVVVWEMSFAGTAVTANLININPGPTWHVVGLRDMNKDGAADILFQNDNGAAAVWEDYQALGAGSATFNKVLAIDPNPNPNGHVWDLL